MTRGVDSRRAHEVLKVRLCKQPDCEKLADKTTGPYAMHCHFYTEQARRARRASLNGTGPPPPVAETNGASLEFRAASLVELGRKVDEARATLEPAQAAYEEACRRWQEAVGRLPAANGLLTNGLAQAVTTDGPDGV
jgi:hypothetical protein